MVYKMAYEIVWVITWTDAKLDTQNKFQHQA